MKSHRPGAIIGLWILLKWLPLNSELEIIIFIRIFCNVLSFNHLNKNANSDVVWDQGLVKGAKLCLNLYFFDWLEKWVSWLLKYSLHVENKSKDFWNKISLLLQDLVMHPMLRWGHFDQIGSQRKGGGTISLYFFKMKFCSKSCI